MAKETKAKDPIKVKTEDFKNPTATPKPAAPDKQTPPNAGGGDDFGFLGY